MQSYYVKELLSIRIHTASQLDILTQDVMFFFFQKNTKFDQVQDKALM